MIIVIDYTKLFTEIHRIRSEKDTLNELGCYSNSIYWRLDNTKHQGWSFVYTGLVRITLQGDI